MLDHKRGHTNSAVKKIYQINRPHNLSKKSTHKYSLWQVKNSTTGSTSRILFENYSEEIQL